MKSKGVKDKNHTQLQNERSL